MCVTLIVVVLASGVIVYTANLVVVSSNQFCIGNYAAIDDGSKGGGFTGIEKGGGSS